MFTARNLKILAVSYVVKTVVLGVAWLMVPDLPQRVTGAARSTWTRVVGAPAR